MSSVTDGAAHYLFSKFIITESMKMLSLSIRQKIESYLRTKCEACHIAVMCSQGMNPKYKFNLVKDVIISVLDIGWSDGAKKKPLKERVQFIRCCAPPLD